MPADVMEILYEEHKNFTKAFMPRAIELAKGKFLKKAASNGYTELQLYKANTVFLWISRIYPWCPSGWPTPPSGLASSTFVVGSGGHNDCLGWHDRDEASVNRWWKEQFEHAVAREYDRPGMDIDDVVSSLQDALKKPSLAPEEVYLLQKTLEQVKKDAGGMPQPETWYNTDPALLEKELADRAANGSLSDIAGCSSSTGAASSGPPPMPTRRVPVEGKYHSFEMQELAIMLSDDAHVGLRIQPRA